MQISRRMLLTGIALSVAGGSLAAGTGHAPASAAPAAQIPELGDADFFGAWNAAEQRWATAPQLNYADFPLQQVEAAAKAGRYEDAGNALRAYYRGRPARTTAGYSTNGSYPDKRFPLIADNIWSLGKGEIYHSTVTLPAASSAVSIDLTDVVARDLAAGGLGLMLMARRKGPGVATVASRHAGSGAPVLRVTTDGGQWDLAASASTYIAAGSEADRGHGGEDTLVIADSGTGPYGAATRKSYLWFDLGAVTGKPTSAVLRLTGSSTQAGMGVLVYEDKETFDESTRTWNNTIQNTLSYQGDPGGFDWTWPDHTDKEWYYQLPRFYWSGPMADAYAASKDEKLAGTMVRQMRDFIADADTYDSPAGAGSYPRNLDVGWRVQHWVYAFEALRASTALDASTSTSVLKTLIRSEEFLRGSTSDTPNHVFSFMGALLFVAGYFPELSGSSGWIDDAGRVLAEQLADSLYPDGGYTEATYSYAYGTIGSFLDIAEFCKANQIDFTPGADLHRLAWYVADELYPDGTGPNYGDSSNRDFTTDLSRLADHFDDDRLRHVASLGTAGTAPDHTSVAYPDTRVAVQRTGWRRADWYLRMNLDRGPHQHPDELAIQVYAHDRPLLPAMGAFSYSDDPKSNWLRTTTQANTTVTIDEVAQDPTAAGEIGSPLQASWATASRGWTDATPGVRHTRTAILIDGGTADGFWLVTDALDPADTAEHRYEQNWHLVPDANPSLTDDGTASTAFATGTNLTIVPLLSAGLTGKLADGYYSDTFYQVLPTRYVSYGRRATGSTRLATLLLPVLPGTQRSATATVLATDHGQTMIRLNLTGSDERTAIVALAGKPGRSTPADGYAFDGTFGYLETHGDRTRMLVDQCRSVTAPGTRLLAANRRLGPTAVVLDKSRRTVTVDTDTDASRATITIDAPWAETVTVNGEQQAPRRSAGNLTVTLP